MALDDRSAATACPICGEAHGDECPSVTAEDQKRGYETAAKGWRVYTACALTALWGAGLALGAVHFGMKWLAGALVMSLGFALLGRWVAHGE